MKKSFKNTIAVVLCIALTVAILPATVFASGEYENGSFVLGELTVVLYEQYYTADDEVYGDLADILPEIEIEEYSDTYLSVLLSSPLPREKWKPSLVAKVGTTFKVKLVEKTAQAVEAAIEALKDNPYVKTAEKIGYAYPDDPGENGFDEEITVSYALRVLRIAVGIVEATPEIVSDYDKDGDGAVTVADALLFLRIAAGLA